MRHHTMGVTGLLAAIVGGLFLTLPAAAQTYKWTDPDGKIHYSDQPPPSTVKEEPVIKRAKNAPPPPAAATTGEKGKNAAPKAATPQEQEAEFRKRQVEKQEAESKEAKQTAADAQRQRACGEARAYLQNLQAGNRIVKIDPKTGERAYLEDAQYAGEIAAAQKSVDANCK